MKYMGSKNRIANEILPLILKERKPMQFYVEPFCGGLGTADKVTGNVICSDKNKYLIEMWNGLKLGYSKPYIITKEMYNNARLDFNSELNQHYNDFLIGWIGWMASYNGRFFDGGYSGISSGRDYIDEQIRNTVKQIPKIQHINFVSYDYELVAYPDNSIIYCDIPYLGTKQYCTSNNFDYRNFYNWFRFMKIQGHQMFLSEYQAPNDFICIWEKEVTNSMNQNNTYKPIERLFTV